MEKNFIHSSSNLAFVAALVSYGASIEETNKSDIRRVVFTVNLRYIDRVFVLEGDRVVDQNPLSFDNLLNLFVSDKLMLMPNYMTKVTDLKSLIYG